MIGRRLGVAALLLAIRPAAGQTPPAVTDWIREHAAPFDLADTAPPALDRLAQRFARARIVGIGESIHFQHQFLELRFALSRALIRRGGVSAIALESGLAEALGLDDYVAGRTDHVDWTTALAYGNGSYGEVRRTFEWLRAWNAAPGHRPVRVYGVDLGRSAGSMVPALERLGPWLERADPRAAERLTTVLLPLARRTDGREWFRAKARYDSLTPSVRDSLAREVAALVASVERQGPRAADRRAWEVADRLAVVARQQVEFLTLGPYHPTNPRDVAMAANTRWVLAREGGQVLLWAHNAHVSKAPIEGPASPAKQPVPSMGTMLAATLGSGYVGVMTTYLRAPTDSVADPASLDGTLGSAVAEPFWIAPTDARGPAAAWMAAPHAIQFQGVGYLRVVPARAFDAVVSFPRIEPAKPVDPPAQ